MSVVRKTIFWMFATLAVAWLAGFLRSPQPVSAAAYPQQTLVGDLGLPETVVQVLVGNSLDADGQPVAEDATAVTVADVQQWQTVSLAQRTANADTGYTSSTSDTVADWIAGLATNTDSFVETHDMLLAQDLSDGSYSAQALLSGQATIPVAYGRTQAYTLANLPVLNKLMAVLMSATNAQTIDLTGIVSQVADPATRVKILALFQTKVMPQLTELDLGYNMFGPGVTDTASWYYYMFRSRTLTSTAVVTWDLSYEGLTSLDADLLAGIGSQTRNVNLTSNVLTTINYNNGGYLDTGGKIDLSNNDNLDSDNSDTFIVLATIISTGGNTVLPDAVANAVVAKALNNWPNISNLGIDALAPQLTTATLTAIATTNNVGSLISVLDPTKLLAASVQAMSDADYQRLYANMNATQQAALAAKRSSDASGNTAKLNASGQWTFGNYTIGQTAPVVGTAATAVVITGNLPANQQLCVSMSRWSSGDSTIAPQLSLEAGDNGWQAVDLGVDAPVVVLTNPNTTTMAFSQRLAAPLLTVPTDQVTALQAGAAYTGTLTWTIANVPTTDVQQ